MCLSPFFPFVCSGSISTTPSDTHTHTHRERERVSSTRYSPSGLSYCHSDDSTFNFSLKILVKVLKFIYIYIYKLIKWFIKWIYAACFYNCERWKDFMKNILTATNKKQKRHIGLWKKLAMSQLFETRFIDSSATKKLNI